MLVMDSPVTEDGCAMNNNHPKEMVQVRYLSWHPHVYANPPKQPTPHMISDILGWEGPKDSTPVAQGDESLNLTVRIRSPQRPFREPTSNGVDKPVNGRLEFPKAMRRVAAVNKGESPLESLCL